MTPDRLTLAVRLAAGITAHDPETEDERVARYVCNLLAAIEAEMARREPSAPASEQDDPPAPARNPGECMDGVSSMEPPAPPDPAPDGDADQTAKMRTASYLLPDPGGEVVRQLLDRIERDAETIRERDERCESVCARCGVPMDRHTGGRACPVPPDPAPDGDALERYGVYWRGPQEPICEAMSDGYWTPWHHAQARISWGAVTIQEQQETIKRLARQINKLRDAAFHFRCDRHRCDTSNAQVCPGCVAEMRETIREQQERIAELRNEYATFQEESGHRVGRFVGEAKQLREQIATLTRERDEARADVDQSRTVNDQSDEIGRLRAAIRGALRDMGAGLTSTAAQGLRAALARRGGE